MEPRWKQLKFSQKIKENLGKRAKILASIRSFFDTRGFLEVETPIIVSKPGMEPHLDPFRTIVVDPRGNSYSAALITSPEYAMKKLLAAGFGNIYQIVKCFRNGEAFEGRHNPEFTMIEWYRTKADYVSIMNDTEGLVKEVARNVLGKLIIHWRGSAIDLGQEWLRLSVRDALRVYADIDLDRAIEDKEILLQAAKKLGHDLEEKTSWDDAFYVVFLNAVEPHLGMDRPTFLYEYPVSMAALSRVSGRDCRYAERFELYIGGLEIANAFTELTDAAEQRLRLQQERALRASLGRFDHGLDEDFLSALEEGMPEAGGIALGVDRLVMLLLGEEDIRNVMAFPADSMFGMGSG